MARMGVACAKISRAARMVKLVDTRDLKSRARKGVPVRFRLRAPYNQRLALGFTWLPKAVNSANRVSTAKERPFAPLALASIQSSHASASPIHHARSTLFVPPLPWHDLRLLWYAR